MRCSAWSTTASSGGRCPPTSPTGRPFTASSAASSPRAGSPNCTTGCAAGCAPARAAIRSPRRASSTHKSVKADAVVEADTRGYDGAKKINGRKRHLAVDCLGLLLAVLVTPASTADRQAATVILPHLREKYFRLKLLWADGGYTGTLLEWAPATLRLALTVVKRTDTATGFKVLPRGWVVERTNAWLMRTRRLARDYERTPACAEAMVYWSMTAS
ncbi:transposase [Streptacidiphilus sp. N1-10]|uniref:Transposase n=1 Tax=Streptacidiphilus jeojiensis TaxID=3229225 RepID=A0ABV6XXW3_9ACTN